MNNQIQLVLKSSTTELSLNDHELGIYLTPELDGLTGLPDIRTTSGVNAGYDGGWTSAQNYDARSITIRGVIANEDVATVEQLRRQLTTLAGQGKNEELTLDLVTQAGKAYTIQVRTIALEMSLQKVLTQQEFMLQLRADDPLIYDASETTHEALLQVAQATGGFTIDFELPLAITGSSEETIVNNEGLEQVPTVTRMYGALHNPKLINQTTNQSMQIMADLGFAEGDWTTPSEPVEGKDLTINGAPENALLSDFKLKGETSQQTYTGKNLLNCIQRSEASQGITCEVSNTNTLTVSGQSTTSYANLTERFDTSITAGTFTFVSSQALSHRLTLRAYYDGGYNNAIIEPGDTYKTFTMSSDIIGMYVYMATGATGVNYDETFTVQLVSGSTPDYDFEPYVGGVPAPNPDYPQPVHTVTGENVVKICGKNLINVVDSEVTRATRCTHEAVGGGVKIVASGVSGLSYCMFNVHNQGNILGKTVYISCNAAAEVSSAHIRVYQIANGAYTQIGSNIPISGGSVSIPATLISDTSIIRVGFYVSSGTAAAGTALTITNAQLELGSTATAYEPYQGQSYPISLGSIELCKLGTYQDYIYKSDGKWYVRKAVKKVVFDGSESWSKSGNVFVNSADYTDLVSAEVDGVALCNGFSFWKNTGNISTKMPNLQFGFRSAKDSIDFRYNALSAASDWETWLASNPAVVYYALATPTDTEITNQALVAQLEAILQEAKMYNPQTNITTLYAAGNEQGTLSISYFTDKNPDTRDELVIDSRLRTITLNGLDVYHLQAPGSEFLMLAPGENRLALQSDITGDNGYAQVSYKQGYLSI